MYYSTEVKVISSPAGKKTLGNKTSGLCFLVFHRWAWCKIPSTFPARTPWIWWRSLSAGWRMSWEDCGRTPGSRTAVCALPARSSRLTKLSWQVGFYSWEALFSIGETRKNGGCIITFWITSTLQTGAQKSKAKYIYFYGEDISCHNQKAYSSWKWSFCFSSL